jgi:transposase-like protein|tara:strand:+ start:1127 stop:1333 length:207 start_codon:yes stop_codon:yes gene_type:complete
LGIATTNCPVIQEYLKVVNFKRKQSKAIDKEGIVEAINEGMSVRKAANKFGVAPSTVSRIKQQQHQWE